jgi:hypothetical protein
MKSFSNLKSGILTGTTFAIIPNLHWYDIIRTIVLAFIGAVVSAIVSYVIQQMKRKTQ